MANPSPAASPQDQMAAIQALLQQYNAPNTAENLNRASQHIAQVDAVGPLLFDQAMERAVAAPKPRQVAQAKAARNATPSEADGSQYAGGPAGSSAAVPSVPPAAAGGLPNAATVSSPPTGGAPAAGGLRVGPAGANAAPAVAGELTAPSAATAGPPLDTLGQPLDDAAIGAAIGAGGGVPDAGLLPYLAAIMARKRMPGNLGVTLPQPGALPGPSGAAAGPGLAGGAGGNTTVSGVGPMPRLADPNPTLSARGPGQPLTPGNVMDPSSRWSPGDLQHPPIPQPGIINMPTPPGGSNAVTTRRLAEYDAGGKTPKSDDPVVAQVAKRTRKPRRKADGKE